MHIDKAELRTLIPHAGTMCLLDGVRRWDTESIECVSNTHRDKDNPLRRDDRLAALHAFEDCAQAAAVHGGLLARERGREALPAYLAALRDGRLHVDYLHDVDGPLDVRAELAMRDRGSCIYVCGMSVANQPLAQVRITVMLRPGVHPAVSQSG
ncbi:MAG: hypothetical protein ACR2RB_05530 [Gammaproteobacteria bacterium]